MFPFSHNTLMMLNIGLAAIHILLSGILLSLHINKVELPSYTFPAFFIISIIACILILLYSLDCKNRFGKEHENK